MPDELPNELRLTSYEIRKNQENIKTIQNYKLVPSLPVKQNENPFNINPKPLEKWILNFSGSALFHIKLEFASTIL